MTWGLTIRADNVPDEDGLGIAGMAAVSMQKMDATCVCILAIGAIRNVRRVQTKEYSSEPQH